MMHSTSSHIIKSWQFEFLKLQDGDDHHFQKLKLLYLRKRLSYRNEILYNVVRRHIAAYQQLKIRI